MELVPTRRVLVKQPRDALRSQAHHHHLAFLVCLFDLAPVRQVCYRQLVRHSCWALALVPFPEILPAFGGCKVFFHRPKGMNENIKPV